MPKLLTCALFSGVGAVAATGLRMAEAGLFPGAAGAKVLAFQALAGAAMGFFAGLLVLRSLSVRRRAFKEEGSRELLRKRTTALVKQSLALARARRGLKASQRRLARYRRRLDFTTQAATDAFLDWDLVSGHIYWSPRFFDMLGYEPGEMPKTYEKWRDDILWPEDREKVAELVRGLLEGALESTETEYRLLTKQGKTIWVWSRARAEGGDPGARPERVLGALLDVTRRKEAELALADSEAKFRNLVELAKDGIAIIQDERLVYVNPHLAEMMGYSIEDALGRPFADFISPRTRRDALERYSKIIAGERVEPLYEHVLLRKDGRELHVEVCAGPSTHKGRPADFAYLRDVTESRQSQRRLAESEARYRGIFDAANDALLLYDMDGHIVDANPRACEMFGHSRDALLSMHGRALVHPSHQRLFDQLLLRAGMGESFYWEALNQKKDGGTVYVEGKGSRLDSLGGSRLLAVLRDATERRTREEELRASEELFSKIFFLSPVAISITSLEHGRLVNVNDAFARLIGASRESCLGRPAVSVWAEASQRDAFLVELLRKRRLLGFEVQIRKDNGELCDCIYSSDMVEIGGETHVLSMGIDITERKRDEEHIRTALEEKEVLLREVHHRVKNNFLVIISLLSLQAGHVKDDGTRRVLAELQERIRSMALVHQRLYQSGSMAKVDFLSYVREMCGSLFTSFAPPGGNVSLVVDGEGVFLGVDSAIPCGMIVSELVTNALKYAFPEGGKGILAIRVEQERGRIRIRVQDNGRGLPEDVTIKNSQSFGLLLVRLLTEQLRGTLEVKRDMGTTITLSFEEREKRR
jgi:PAS domain S-box-containing protein